MQRLKLDEYAQRLCAAKKAYNYPAVTCYDFDAFLKGKRRRLYERKHTSMSDVENLIRKQLVSQNTDVVKNGLSNVLYWGFATDSRQSYQVQVFRDGDDKRKLLGVNDEQIANFINFLNSGKGISLQDISRMKLPRFGGMSFSSKLLMFLSPEQNPVLDMQIATFAVDNGISPVRNLTFRTKKIAKRTGKSKDNTIRLTRHNMDIYERWASWCKHVAVIVNEYPSSSCKDLRAVDVERAIYRSIPNEKDVNQDTTEAQLLLAGPDIN